MKDQFAQEPLLQKKSEIWIALLCEICQFLNFGNFNSLYFFVCDLFIFLILFYFLTLQYCIGFAIYQNESVTLFKILNKLKKTCLWAEFSPKFGPFVTSFFVYLIFIRIYLLYNEFLLYAKVNQLNVYICSLFFRFSSHLCHHRALSRVPYSIL